MIVQLMWIFLDVPFCKTSISYLPKINNIIYVYLIFTFPYPSFRADIIRKYLKVLFHGNMNHAMGIKSYFMRGNIRRPKLNW